MYYDEKLEDIDLVPMTFVIVKRIQNGAVSRPLVCLFDTGATSTWVKRKTLPRGTHGQTVPSHTSATLAGEFSSKEVVNLQDLTFPEFSPSRTYDRCPARVFDADCRYDIIFGRDMCRQLGIKLDMETALMQVDGQIASMKPYTKKSDQTTADVATELFLEWVEEDLLDDIDDNDDAFASDDVDDFDDFVPPQEDDGETDTDDPLGSGYHSKTIKMSSYDKVDIDTVIKNCKHLTEKQQEELRAVLRKYERLFDGKLKKYVGEKIHLELEPNYEPHRSRAYQVPFAHLKVFKAELDRLVKIGVLEPQGRAEWIAGTFIIPKKDTSVRWISDFRALNKYLKRKVYPLPRIGDILARRTGYKFLTKLDISMQYYTFELDDESSDMCTIATPFGLYKYRRLPMGVTVAPDIAQEVMEKVLRGIEDIEKYLDDIACFSTEWEQHLEVIDKVLDRLQEAGFTINPAKCEWAVQETDFLGHWLTPNGIKPYKKKVAAILRMQAPQNLKQLRSFLGLVNYYRDMWPRRSHVLAPLTAMTGKKTFEWLPEHEAAFKQMKAIVATDALLAYPDHNKSFHIETDASDYQLGAVIKQDGRPVAYYTRKLNSAQQNYTTIEKELLSIVETLREFRSMLLGAELHIHTDHRNLTHKMTAFTTQRVMRWRLLLEEFGAKFHYKKGGDNFIADALSRVPTEEVSRRKTKVPVVTRPSESLLEDYPAFSSILDDVELAECFLEFPRFEHDMQPYHFDTIYQYQQRCEALKALVETDPQRFAYRQMGARQIVCFQPLPDGKWQIALTDEILPKVVKWYHEVLVHTEGAERLIATLSRHFHHPNLANEVRKQCDACDICARMKPGHRQYGELAPRDAPLVPWQEVHVDCIGQWQIKVRGVNLAFNALTMIDPVTNLLEIVRVSSKKTSAEVSRAFENTWLARYPRPLKVVCDKGHEFTGFEWEKLLADAQIKKTYITTRNPQGNSVIERTHLAIAQVLRTLIELKPPNSKDEADALIESAFATAMHAARCASNSQLMGHSPGSLAFKRDMFLDIPMMADLLLLQKTRQLKIDERLLRANAKRLFKDYKVGDRVYALTDRKSKVQPVYKGPFEVETVHTNGTVTIRRGPNIRERINIRQLKPVKKVRFG